MFVPFIHRKIRDAEKSPIIHITQKEKGGEIIVSNTFNMKRQKKGKKKTGNALLEITYRRKYKLQFAQKKEGKRVNEQR